MRGATFTVIRTSRMYESERSGGRGFPNVTVAMNGTILSVALTHDGAAAGERCLGQLDVDGVGSLALVAAAAR